MKNRILIIMIATLLICIGFIGCTEEVDKTNKFIGIWDGKSYFLNSTSDVSFTFYEDKTAQQIVNKTHPHWYNYELDSDCLYLSFLEFPQIDAICYYYEFSNNNSTVTLTNESLDTLILTRQMEH
jgi:hypothetical protein